MKKLVCIILALLLAVCFAFGEETTDSTDTEEEGILVHGYISPYAHYYIAVPAEWCIIGAGCTIENKAEAIATLDDDVEALLAQMNEQNDVLICKSAKNEGLILTYGECNGVSNSDMIDSIDEIEAELAAQYNGLSFKDESGSYSYMSVADILFLSMTYKNTDIYQYYLVSGSKMYTFTFFGTDTTTAEAVMSLFSMTES